MRCSAYGRSRFALLSVVVIRPCSNSADARLASISRSCAGLPPIRGPLLGVGMSLSDQEREGARPSVGADGGCRGPELPVNRDIELLELLGLGKGLAVVVSVGEVRLAVLVGAVGVDDLRRVEPGRAVLERK